MHIDIKSLVEKGKAKKIKNHEDYIVTKNGRVFSCKSNKFLKPYLCGKKGKEYKTVSLYKKGKEDKRTVHSLVAEAFIGKRPKNKIVGHKDRNRFNNHADNLEYVTEGQNRVNTDYKKANKSSPYMGVCISKGRIRATTHRDMGEFFDCEIEAAKAYDRAVYKKFGKHALCKLNFPELINE